MEINGIIIKFKPMEKGNIIMLLLIQGNLPTFIFFKKPFRNCFSDNKKEFLFSKAPFENDVSPCYGLKK